MPIYEYHCRDCDNSFETLIRPGHDDEALCPSCTSTNISREMSVFASRAAGSRVESNSGGSTIRVGGGCCGGFWGCH